MKRDGKTYHEARQEVERDIEQCIKNQKEQKQLEKEQENLKSPKEKFKDEFSKLKNG